MGVNRSWFYERAQRSQSPRESSVTLRDEIERIALEFPAYGYRRITKELSRREVHVNHKRVLHIMREESLLCHLKRRFIITTDSTHHYRAYPNLARKMNVTGVNQLWQADLTYIRLRWTFVYLACIVDAFSRKVVGWHISKNVDTLLTLKALWMAISARDPQPGLVHHSDRGVQYAATDYVEALDEIGAQISMSRPGNPYDNAKAESFFRTLKVEQVNLNEYNSIEEANEDMKYFIESVYNQRRLHSSLGYVPPDEFEQAHQQNMGLIYA